MFVKLLRGALIGDKWWFKDSVLNLPEDRAKILIKEGCVKLDSGPEKEVVPEVEENVIHYGAKPVAADADGDPANPDPAKRGPGRPRKDA